VLVATLVVTIKFRIRNEARGAAAPPAGRFGGPAAGREGAGVNPGRPGPARRGAGHPCGTGGWRLTRPGLQGRVPANPGAAGHPAVAAAAGPLRRAIPDRRGQAGLRVGFGTVPAPTPGRRGPVHGGQFSGSLPGLAGACPIQARLLRRRGQVAVHARPAGGNRTTTRQRPAGRDRTTSWQRPAGRHQRVAAASPATIGRPGRGPRTTPGTGVRVKVTRPAGLLTRCCGPPASRGARLVSATRVAPARVRPEIVGSARRGRRVTAPALAWTGSAPLAGDALARRGGPGVTGRAAWSGGACVAAGSAARCTGRSVPTRRLAWTAGPVRRRLPGCARGVVAAGRLPRRPRTPRVRRRRPAITRRLPGRRAGAVTDRGLTWRPGPSLAGRRVSREPAPGAGRGRVAPSCLRISGDWPPALARHRVGVLGRRVRPPGQVTGVLGSGIDRATRPPPTRRLLRALVGHMSPCRASDAILPDRELPHHGAWQRCLPPGLARSSARAGTFARTASQGRVRGGRDWEPWGGGGPGGGPARGGGGGGVWVPVGGGGRGGGPPRDAVSVVRLR
jgi:hypothetical protein